MGESDDESPPGTFTPGGSNRGGRGGNEASEAPDEKGSCKKFSERTGHNAKNTEQDPKPWDVSADQASTRGRLTSCGKRAKGALHESAGALVTACSQKETGE